MRYPDGVIDQLFQVGSYAFDMRVFLVETTHFGLALLEFREHALIFSSLFAGRGPSADNLRNLSQTSPDSREPHVRWTMLRNFRFMPVFSRDAE